MWWRSSVWSPRRVPCRNGWMRAALIVSICSFTEWVSNNLYHIKVSGLLCCNICLIEILEMIFNIKYLTKCWLIGEEGTSSQPAPGLALKCSFGTLNCSVTANSQWWPRGAEGPPLLPPSLQLRPTVYREFSLEIWARVASYFIRSLFDWYQLQR